MYGPGRSARAICSCAPRQLRQALAQHVEIADDERGRLRVDAALGAVEPADGVLGVRRRREPVDGVGRDDRQLRRLRIAATASSTSVTAALDDAVAARQVGGRGDVGVAEPAEHRRGGERLPVADLEHEVPAGRGARRRAARATASGTPSPTSATCGS